MVPPTDERVAELFKAALDVEPSTRHRFLEEHCAGDVALLTRVERLLALDAADDSFLVFPPLARDVDDAAVLQAETMVGLAIGNFRIVREIASGGMGTVYEARQEQPRRSVALKLLKRGLASASVLRRFEQEAELLGRLRHPGIAQVYVAGIAGITGPGGATLELPYFAMEYVSQATPITKYAAREHLTIRERIDLFLQLCDAVHHGHQKGIIHRDLKPTNVLVDDSGQVKVIDFGVARLTGSDVARTTTRTAAGELVGTLQYMSPEQCGADPNDVDTRSDVYALGVLLYELLTEQLPYDVLEVSIPEAIRAIHEQRPPRPSGRQRALRGDLDVILLKALEKERERRYQSAAELALDLRRLVAGQPILARAPSVLYQLRVFARRNRAVTAALAALALSLIAGMGVSTWLAIRAQRQTTRAERTLQFLTRNLSAVDPFRQILGTVRKAGGIDRDLKVASLLQTATLDLDAGELSDQREVEAALRHVIGSAYLGLGRWLDAEPQLERAVALRRQVLGSEHRETLESMTLLGTLRVLLRGAADGRSLLREAAATAARVLDPEDPQTLAALQANLLDGSRSAEEMQTAAEALVQVQTRILGADDPRTFLTQVLLCEVLYRRGFRAEHLRRSRATVDAARQALGDHPMTYWAMGQLGIALQETDASQAEPVWSECAGGCRRHLGEDHPWTIQTTNGHAISLMRLGRLHDAEPLFRWCLDTERRVLGERGGSDPFKMSRLAELLGRTDRLLEGIEMSREAVATAERLWGDGGDTPVARCTLASLLVRSGNLEEATKQLRLALDAYRRAGSSGNGEAIAAMSQLARLLERQREFVEAEELRREVVDLHRQIDGDGDRRTLRAKNQLAWFLAGRGRLAEAEPFARAAVDGYREFEGASCDETVAALDTLAVVLRDSERRDEAEPLFLEAIADAERDAPESPTLLSEVRLHYGESLLQSERLEAAEAQLLQGYAELSRFAGDSDELKSRTLGRLIELYVGAGRPEKAEECRGMVEGLK
jgi:tetratricopeptide (TPR) repeat protein